MPWDSREFRAKFNKKLSDRMAGKAAKVANAVLKKSGDEGQAIRIANAAVKKSKKR